MSEEKISVTMRTEFPPHQISRLPKPTKAQTDAVKADYTVGRRCVECGGWHHPQVVHLDYVGHAALTDRMLDVDPMWNWEPVAFDGAGLPAIDANGGLWIRLTINNVTRLGYGDAPNKTGGDAMKERIGDALRNAAMRFGAALPLWHKGDLHLDGDADTDDEQSTLDAGMLADYLAAIAAATTQGELLAAYIPALESASSVGDKAAADKLSAAKGKKLEAIKAAKK